MPGTTISSRSRFVRLALSLCLAATGCLPHAGDEKASLPFHIEGEIQGTSAERIFLSAPEGDTFVVVDTATLGSDGRFSFEGEISTPDVFRLSTSEDNALLLVIDARHIEVKCPAGDFPDRCQVIGSVASRHLGDLMLLSRGFRMRTENLERKFAAARDAGETDSLIFYQERFLATKNAFTAGVKEFIRSHPDSFIGPYAAYTLLDEAESEFLDSMLISFNENIPGSKYVQLLSERQTGADPVTVGAMAPDISLPRPDGRKLRLSSLRGQVVLIDFWASWCRPCREENPDMVRLYRRYHGSGFEILGVSLDESMDQWTDAIRKDGLPWHHVSDLKGSNSAAARAYRVQAIPMTVLVNPEGRILATNLRGNTLEAALAALFPEN